MSVCTTTTTTKRRLHGFYLYIVKCGSRFLQCNDVDDDADLYASKSFAFMVKIIITMMMMMMGINVQQLYINGLLGLC